jgi:hypothetical protein
MYAIGIYEPYDVIRANDYTFIYLNNKFFLLANKFLRFHKLGISVITLNHYDVDINDEYRNEAALFFYDDNGNKINIYYDKEGKEIIKKPIIKDLGLGNWQPSSSELYAKSFNDRNGPEWWRVELDGLHLEQ